jgi:hypothetical protein
MQFVTITIFTVAGRLAQALAIAKPAPNLNAGGMAIPLARHSFLDSNESMDLDAISSHGISVREYVEWTLTHLVCSGFIFLGRSLVP